MNVQLTVLDDDQEKPNGDRFLPSALLDMLGAIAEGVPGHRLHDYLLLEGWIYPFAVCFEPGYTAVIGAVEEPETREDQRLLADRLSEHQVRWVEAAHRDELEELDSFLGSYLRRPHMGVRQECVSRVQPELAAELFPDIFALQDKEGLVSLRDLEHTGPGVFRCGDLAIFAHPHLRRSLYRLNTLNTPLLDQLQRLAERDELDIRIALDPDMVGLASSYEVVHEFMHWWGPHFSEDLTSIPEGITRHEAEEEERRFYGISRTEFAWQSRDELHMLEVEELRDRPTAPLLGEGTQYGCRYLHSVVNEVTGNVDHLDGAIRMYSEEEMLRRFDEDVRTGGREVPYTKLWKVTGHVDVSTWKRLVSDFYRDNRLIGEYLGGQEAVELSEPQREYDPERRNEEHVVQEPDAAVEWTGIRLVLCQIPSEELVRLADGSYRVDNAVQLRVPAHIADSDELPTVLAAVRARLREVAESDQNQLGRYAMAWSSTARIYVMSVVGRITDLLEWSQDPLAIPVMKDGQIGDWANSAAGRLADVWPAANGVPSIWSILDFASIIEALE